MLQASHFIILTTMGFWDGIKALVELAEIIQEGIDSGQAAKEIEEARQAFAPVKEMFEVNGGMSGIVELAVQHVVEEVAVPIAEEILEIPLVGDALSPHCFHIIGKVASHRFSQTGKMEDLEKSVMRNRQALTVRHPGHPDRHISLNELALALTARFRQFGKIEDLEEAIKYLQEGLSLCRREQLDCSTPFSNLAQAMHSRFRQLGRKDDLEEAITYNREAVALCAPGHPDHTLCLNNLANVLSTRFNELGRIEDLTEAIACLRKALPLCSSGHLRHSLLSNLAYAMCAQFGRSGKMEDLEEAITCQEKALDLCLPLAPDRYSPLNNLASYMYARFEKLGSMGDLGKAIEYASKADDVLPTEHPMHVLTRLNLAVYYLEQHGADGHIAGAFDLFKQAATHLTASSMARFDAALRWASEARLHRHESVIHAYSESLTLLDRWLVATPTMELQQEFLATTATIPRSLASDAASSAIEAGKIETAVELLEQGRAILWSKLRGYRHPLEKLHEVNEELAGEFKSLSGQLESLATSSESNSMAPPIEVGSDQQPDFEVKMQRHRVLSEQWDEAVRKIRLVDGFQDFLRVVPYSTLRKVSAEGPVILVNVSVHRSDAIVIHSIDSPPLLIPLPKASPGYFKSLSSQLLKALALNTHRSKKITPILQGLWEAVVHPVKDELVKLGVAERTRIWWCPTSELCGLPIHAAGPYLSKQKNLPDLYISSYTPTLSALIQARDGLLPRSIVPNLLLVIGQPGETLPKVKEELDRIRKFDTSVQLQLLVGNEAKSDTVLSGLQEHNWAHFACHGHQHIQQPFHSSFSLHDDQRLTLIDLIKARLPNAEFAFLSACHSAAGDREGTPDEVIHLAAALQFSGFRSVVGTLWAMDDRDGPDVTQDFYKHMFRRQGTVADFRDSAMALNLATREMRKRKVPVDRWINFVHIGA